MVALRTELGGHNEGPVRTRSPRWEFKQEVEAVRRELGKKLEAARRRALDKQGHLAFLKKADMRKAHALLHELEQHLLKQYVRL